MPIPVWAAGLAGLIGGAAASHTYNVLTEDDDDDDEFDATDEDTWGEFYLANGERKLARALKNAEVAADMDEALELVAEYLEGEEKLVAKYERRQVRKAEREATRESARKAREAKSAGGRRATA